MAEIRQNFSHGHESPREMVCIDTYRVLDSCRDKDCFENVRVYLTDYGQELIDRVTAVRAKCAGVVWSYIDIDTVPFNRGFYQLTIKIYVKIISEVCVAPGNIQEIDGIAVVEKKVILFGSEGNVSIFKSTGGCSGFCAPGHGGHHQSMSNNLPIAVLETVDPIILNSKIVEPKECNSCCVCCCCCADEVPEGVCSTLSGNICDRDDCNKLTVSLGFFSVVRIERPAQYLINAAEYCVPDKECVMAEEDDPCKLFRSMSFPVNEFCPPSVGRLACDSDPIKPSRGGCGCGSCS